MEHLNRNERPEFQDNASNVLEISEKIPTELRQSYRNELFYLGESSCKSGNKSFFFATPNNMLLLSQIAHWCCDGTFDVAPKLLKQLFTLNVILKGKFIILIQFEVFIYFNFR
jgi:hypothetical protein